VTGFYKFCGNKVIPDPPNVNGQPKKIKFPDIVIPEMHDVREEFDKVKHHVKKNYR